MNLDESVLIKLTGFVQGLALIPLFRNVFLAVDSHRGIPLLPRSILAALASSAASAVLLTAPLLLIRELSARSALPAYRPYVWCLIAGAVVNSIYRAFQRNGDTG